MFLSFIAFLDGTIVLTALPAIEKALSTSMVKLQWAINAFTLLFRSLLLPDWTFDKRHCAEGNY